MIDDVRKLYNVKTYGADVLNQVAEKVTEFDDKLTELAKNMTEIMDFFDGIGLAAPQIGISKRVVILKIPNNEYSNNHSIGETILLPQMPVIMINPEIIAEGDEFADYDEGCLSVPEIFANVVRPLKIVVKYQNLKGVFFEYECDGLLARCIQHEIDHLEGLTFIDRLDEFEFKKVKAKLSKLEKFGKKKDFNRIWKK